MRRAEASVRSLTHSLHASMEQCEVAVREVGRLQQLNKVERAMLVQTALAALQQLRSHLTTTLTNQGNNFYRCI